MDDQNNKLVDIEDKVDKPDELDIAQFKGKVLNKIDQIMDDAGYNCEVWRVFILVSLCILVEGMYFPTFALIFVPFQIHFNISRFEVSMVAAVMFITVSIGSFSAGFFTAKFKRTTIIISTLGGVLICSLFMGFIDNVYSFALFRCLLGFFMGVNIPIACCILVEYLPLHLRSFMQSAVWITFNIGFLIVLLIGFISMPNLEASKVLHLNYYSAIVVAIVIILFIFFLNDSPRSLVLNGDHELAFKILDRIAGRPITEEEKRIIVIQVEDGENEKFEKGDLRSIFKIEILLTTLLLMFVWIISSICTYAPYIVLSLTLKKINPEKKNESVYIDLAISFSINSIGNLLCIVSEVKFLGRKITALISFILFSVLLFIGTMVPSSFYYMFGISGVFLNVSWSVVGAYSYEFYSTKIRELANGFLFACTRLGGFSSQFLGVWLDQKGTFTPYYVISSLGLVGAILLAILPHDTYGHHLDVNLDKEETTKLKQEDTELEK